MSAKDGIPRLESSDRWAVVRTGHNPMEITTKLSSLQELAAGAV
jgi:hypothetical protein